MRLLKKLLGVALILAGFYFLSQNIYFTTRISYLWWRDISAAGSVITLLGSLLFLIFGGQEVRQFGWVLLIIAIVLIFISGSVLLKPTSLWTFAVSLAAMISGWSLIRFGRLGI